MRAGSDIEEDHFVGPLLIITNRKFHRISDISEFSGLSFPELHTAGDLPCMDIEAWNDTFCEHRAGRT